MSDHLIAEANRHAKALSKMTLPTTKPNDRDLDWYVRECESLHERNKMLEAENAGLRERLHIADAEIDMWASRCASAIWMLPETVKGGQLREAQDKFHRMLHAARKEAQP